MRQHFPKGQVVVDSFVNKKHSHRIGSIGGCEHDYRVGAEPSCQVHHLFRHIFAGREVDEMLSSGVHDDVFLTSIVDPDHPKTHTTRRDLDCKMAEAFQKLDLVGDCDHIRVTYHLPHQEEPPIPRSVCLTCAVRCRL